MFYRHADTMQHSAQKLSGFMCPRAIVARNIAEESTSTPVSLLFFIRSSYIYIWFISYTQQFCSCNIARWTIVPCTRYLRKRAGCNTKLLGNPLISADQKPW